MQLALRTVPALMRRAWSALVTKAAVPWMTVQNTYGLVRESFAGAWQRNIVVDGHECVLQFSAAYACVTRIANDIAKLRIKLVEQDGDGVWREVDRNSPFAPVLVKPNRYQNRIQFLIEWLLMKLLYGNTYVLKERDERGIVIALYILDSRRVTPQVTPDGGVYYSVASDQLAGLPNGAQLIRASEIIHDRGPTLFHPLIGVSPIFASAASATHGNRIQANAAKFFENQSKPGGVVIVPGTIDETSFARLKGEINSGYSGANLGKTMVLTDGAEYKALSIAPQDAQLIEQLKWTVEDVARAFAMPLYKIGAGPVPTSNNVEALQQQYYTDCLQVLIESLELCLDEGLGLTTAGTSKPLGTELDLDGLMRMDSATTIEKLSKAVLGGLMTPNEGRKPINLPPVTGGDTIYLQQQNFGIEALSKRDAREDPFAKEETTPAPAAAPTPAPAPAPIAEPAPTKALELAAAVSASMAEFTVQMLQQAEASRAENAAAMKSVQDMLAKAAEKPPAAEPDESDVERFAADVLSRLDALEPACL